MGKGNVVSIGAIIGEGVVLGNNNYIGPCCIIGESPEKKGSFEKNAGVFIGDNNRFTKQVTIDAGTERPTIIGNNVLMLKNAHVGHDASIDDFVVLSCNAVVGGWANIGQRTNFGLGAVCHQRISVPHDVMLGMNSTITKKTELKPCRKYAGSPARDIGSNCVKPPNGPGEIGHPSAYC